MGGVVAVGAQARDAGALEGLAAGQEPEQVGRGDHDPSVEDRGARAPEPERGGQDAQGVHAEHAAQDHQVGPALERPGGEARQPACVGGGRGRGDRHPEREEGQPELHRVVLLGAAPEGERRPAVRARGLAARATAQEQEADGLVVVARVHASAGGAGGA
ncbi:MAG: hypothetical protein AB7N76_09175 [Planctomycetota bacterium]